MGAKHHKDKHLQRGQSHDGEDGIPNREGAHGATPQQGPPAHSITLLDGNPSALFTSHRGVIERVASQWLPADLNRASWTLLYSTTQHGRSFPQLVRRICHGGPTMIAIYLTDVCPDAAADRMQRNPKDGADLLLLAYNRSSWESVAHRRGAGGTGTSPPTSGSFFGSRDCFLAVAQLRCDDVNSTPCADAVLCCHPGSANTCFMFLQDEEVAAASSSPIDSFGMGGPRDRAAWCVAEDMEHCWLEPRCRTFDGWRNALLAAAAKAPCNAGTDSEAQRLRGTVHALEVFGLDERRIAPERRREVERKQLVRRFVADEYGGGEGGAGERKSILSGNSALATKALLELGGAHTFYTEREDCCKPE